MLKVELEKSLQFREGHLISDINDDENGYIDSKPLPPNHLDCTGTYAKKEQESMFKKDTNNMYKPEKFDNIELSLDSSLHIPQNVESDNQTDIEITDAFKSVKSLDANKYATKKTIAQGMLDIALLTANASQLKYILQVGRAHEFYTLMLVLIGGSIGLQILSGLLSLSLNIMTDRKMEDTRNGYAVEWVGRARLALSFIVFLDNILIAAFDPMGLGSLLLYDTSAAVVGILFIVLGGLDINRPRDQWAANIINDVILIGVFIISLVNVVISGFGMEFNTKSPESLSYKRQVFQGIICLFLGARFNINKHNHQKRAELWNNIAMTIMLLTVVINIIISVFQMNENSMHMINFTDIHMTR